MDTRQTTKGCNIGVSCHFTFRYASSGTAILDFFASYMNLCRSTSASLALAKALMETVYESYQQQAEREEYIGIHISRMILPLLYFTHKVVRVREAAFFLFYPVPCSLCPPLHSSLTSCAAPKLHLICTIPINRFQISCEYFEHEHTGQGSVATPQCAHKLLVSVHLYI